ncbi:MAG: hypothetical protein ACJATT_001722 [Myxococcota bacterium]|jgi:hypothetical protein
MNTVVRLKITSLRGTGPWTIALDDLRSPPTEAVIDAQEAGRLVGQVRKALQPTTGRRGPDPTVGQALAKVVGCRPMLANQLPFLLGPVTGRAGRPALVVDAHGEAAQWPWELLSGSPEQAPLEHTRRASIARLTVGPIQKELPDPAHRLRVIYWCGVPSDGSNAERVEALEACLTKLADADTLEFGSAVDAPGPSDRPVSTILHIVAGSNDDVIGHIVGADSSQGAGYVASSWLRGVDLVVLDIADGSPTAGVDWARRVVAAGGPACVAPTGTVSGASCKTFVASLYERLLEQDSLADAVASSRARQTRREGSDAWHALFVGDPRVLLRPSLVERRWRPEGWPEPSPTAAEYLHTAYLLAQQAGVGFVGLEHLALALENEEEPPPNAAVMKEVFARRGEDLRTRLAGLVPAPDRVANWSGTARLRAYGGLLTPGFDVDDVWELIAADTANGLHEVAGRPLGTLLASHSAVSLRPIVWGPILPDIDRNIPVALQIVGGPEDGEILQPKVGDVVGRSSESDRIPFPLYATSVLSDRRLSRRHLKWLGEGRVTLARRARVRRGPSELVLQAGDYDLNPGDLLRLTRATRLRVLSRDD